MWFYLDLKTWGHKCLGDGGPNVGGALCPTQIPSRIAACLPPASSSLDRHSTQRTPALGLMPGPRELPLSGPLSLPRTGLCRRVRVPCSPCWEPHPSSGSAEAVGAASQLGVSPAQGCQSTVMVMYKASCFLGS